MKRVGKLVAFNIVMIFLAIILFSKRGIGLGFDPSIGALKFALSIALTFLEVAIFFFVNYQIITEKEKLNFQMTELTNVNNCIQALSQCIKTDPIFESEINRAIEQLKTLERRKDSLNTLLVQNGIQESFKYLNKTADKANFYVFANTKRIINKLIVFDNEEYNQNHNSYDLNEFRSFISNIINDNDMILKQYSNMLIALSSIGDTPTDYIQEIKNMTEALNEVLNGKNFASIEQEYQSKTEV